MKVWISNLAPGTTAEKVEQLLQKYGLPQPDNMLAVPEGTFPGMLAEFRTVSVDDTRNLREKLGRIEGLYWEGRHIAVTTLHLF